MSGPSNSTAAQIACSCCRQTAEDPRSGERSYTNTFVLARDYHRTLNRLLTGQSVDLVCDFA